MLSVVLRSMIVLLFAALLMIVGVSADSPEPANLTLRLSPELQEPGQEASAQSKHALPDNWKKVSSRIRRRVAQMTLNRARQDFGVTGRGVKVGVISDSADGLPTAQALGDLPGGIQILKFGEGSGEGTAMMEIINDLAPGASLAFWGPESPGEFIQGVQQLASVGSRVIVDDLGFVDQPFFEEGPITQVVNQVVSQGVVYVTAAGNDADQHYEADFSGRGSAGGPTSNVHGFAGSVIAQQIVVPPGEVGVVFLQWANPFGFSADDYDLYIVDLSGNIMDRSDDVQDGDDIPFESAVADNRSGAGPKTFQVVIDLFDGAPRRLEMFYGGVDTVAFGVPGGSLFDQPCANGAISVGTINASDPGNDTITGYSSQGPCDFFFPFFSSRLKPDITGIDGVRVTGAAGFPSTFFGTSAAAPHVAGIVALMLEARPSLTPQQAKEALQRSAFDLGPGGIDNIFGGGRANALEAVRMVRQGGGDSPPEIIGLSASLNGDVLTLTGTVADPDGDIAQAQSNVLNIAGQVVAGTQPFPVAFGNSTQANFTLNTNNLNAFPTATQATLLFIDGRGNRSSIVAADFSRADPGGPSLRVANFNGSKLVIKGGGLLGLVQVEINGVIVAAKSNNAPGKVKLNGNSATLNLRAGANRLRVRVGSLRSNILVLGL